MLIIHLLEGGFDVNQVPLFVLTVLLGYLKLSNFSIGSAER